MTAIDHAKKINQLLKALRSSVDPQPAEPRPPIDELVYAFLLWECNAAKAELACKRLYAALVDVNELRVTRPADISAILGKQYPLADERAQRLRAALHEIYLREFAVSLDKAVSLNKRDGRKYIESLEGITPFVAARVSLVALGTHAVPVDTKLNTLLVQAGVIEPDTDVEKSSGILERHIKAGEGLEAHLLLQAWSDDAGVAPAKRKRPRAATEAAPHKKNSTKKAPSPRKKVAKPG